PTAQHATRQAAHVARNIVAARRGEPKRVFAFNALGKMGSLGRRSAVAEIFGVKLSGFLAWWLWRTIYLMKLPGLDRKIRVAAAVRAVCATNVLAIDREAFQALFATLPPLRGFFESLIETRR